MIRVQQEDFDVAEELRQMRAANPAIGALVSFVGLVRDLNEGNAISCMMLEHYPGMTEKSLLQIVVAAQQRWPLLAVRVIHRIGPLAPCDQIVLVAVASAHRGAAFAACEFIMDYLKTKAPFWKKEETPAGSHWVDARETDDSAAARWEN